MWELFFWISLFIGGYFIIYFAADLFLDNLKAICLIYNLSPLIIGMLVLGIDPEESIASIISALNGLPLISMGNIIGNSIIAMTLPFSIALMVKPIKIRPISSFYILLIFSLLIIIFIGLTFNILLLSSGIVAILIYIIYFGWNIKHYSKKDESNDKQFKLTVIEKEVEVPPQSVAKGKKIVLIVIGFILIVIGGELLVYSAEKILEVIQISEAFFGFIIIGFMTNVEELTLVLKSIKKEATEIGIGGMIGKVIWNISITYGISGIIIMNLVFNIVLLLNLLILLVVFIFYSFFFKKQYLKRSHGLVLLLIFVLFLCLNFYTIQT